MTNKFDNLIESMLAEMMPASMMDDFGPGEMTSAVYNKVQDLPGKSQHWGPLQKLTGEDRQDIIRAIINQVFNERGNTYTPIVDNKEELKELIKIAETPEHIKFLIDLSTDKQVDYLKRIEELKKENYVLKNQRDWMLNKILERVNKN